jgi:hypothetical protein
MGGALAACVALSKLATTSFRLAAALSPDSRARGPACWAQEGSNTTQVDHCHVLVMRLL